MESGHVSFDYLIKTRNWEVFLLAEVSIMCSATENLLFVCSCCTLVLDEDTSIIRSSRIRQIFYSFHVHVLPFIVTTVWDVMMPVNELVLWVRLKDVCVAT